MNILYDFKMCSVSRGCNSSYSSTLVKFPQEEREILV